MSYPILQSSTEAALLFFLVQSSDHITGLTGATPTVTLSKNGGAFASPSGTVSEISSGWYKVAANATDTGTLGPLALHATAASADPCDIVVAIIVGYDQAALATPTNITAGTITTTTNLTNLPSIPNNWLTAAGIAASALNGKGDWNIGKTGYSLSVTPPTAAAIATAVWGDQTAGDFTVSASIGKSVMNGVALGSALHISLVDTVTTYTGNTSSDGRCVCQVGSTGRGIGFR